MDNMDIRFGRKNGSYDFNKTDKGIQRSAFGNNAAADSIFKKFDKDHNNILDAQELADAKSAIKEAAEKHKSTNMGKREAANFLGEDYKGTNAQKDILEFLNVIGSSADTVESANTDAKGNTNVVYNHNDTENTQLTENYVKDGENSVLSSKVYNNDDGSKLTETYENGGKTLKSKTLVQGSVTTEFDPKNPDKPISKTTDKGAGSKEVVQYSYNEDGTVTETTSINGKVASHIVKDAQGNVIKSTEYTYDGDKKTTTQKEGNKETIIVEENGKQISATQNTYNDNGKKLSQIKQIGEENYSVEYDGQGNTPVIVQNRETIDDIAKKFNCSKEDLIDANKDLVKGGDKNPKFEVGQEIKIPREVEADDKALQGRKTAQEAIAEHTRDEQIRIQKEAQAEAARLQREAKARAREAQCRELGLKDHKGAGEEVIAHTKTQQGLKLKKIGNASNGRSICEGQGGKLFVVAHDGTVLKTSYVKGTEAYRKGEKVQGRIKDKTGKLIKKQYAIVQKNYDKHGRSVVVDDKGQYHIMAKDGTILSNEYVQKSNKADAIKSDAKTARTETIAMLSAQLDSAQKAFDQQMKEDGWAGDVADGVSILWGSKNRASEVRKDLAQYRNTINELKNCKTEQEFKTKFREKFGVEYNADAVANYLVKPTAANYRRAFGTKQPIGERVAKYNESQQTGAGVVKTTTKVAGAIALTAATVATGGAAGVAAGMAVAAGSAVAADVVVDVTDRVSSEEGLKEGELTEIVKEAAVDGAIAGATFGMGKALGAGYKAYKGAKAASQVAGAAEKAAASTAANAAEQAAANAERAVATAEQAAQKAVAKAESTTAKEVAKNTAREAAQEAEQKAASTAEKAVTKAEGKAAEKGVAKVEEKAVENAAENSQKAAAKSAELTGTEEAVTDAVADTAVGAGAEYAENGEVTLEGTLTNMAMGSVGLAGEKIGSKIKGKFHKSGSPDVDPTGGSHKPDGPDAPKDGPQKTAKEDVNTQKTSEKTQADTDNKTHQTDEPNGTKTEGKQSDSTDNTSRTKETDNHAQSADNTQKTKQTDDSQIKEETNTKQKHQANQNADDFANMKTANISTEMTNINNDILTVNRAKNLAQNYNDITDKKGIIKMRTKIGDNSSGIDKDIRRQLNELNDLIEKNASPDLIKAKNNDVRKALNDLANINLSKQQQRLEKLKNVYLQKKSEEISNKIKNLAEGQEFAINLTTNGDVPDIGIPNKSTPASQVLIKRQNGKIIAENIGKEPLKINGREIQRGAFVELDEVSTLKIEDTELNITGSQKYSEAGGKATGNTKEAEGAKANDEQKAADNTHKEEPKTSKTLNANNETKLSDEINETFGFRTRQKLEKLPEGRSVVLEKGEFRYIVKNEGGGIKIIKKQGNVNFNIPLSNRTPAGEYGRVSMNDALSPESKQVYRDSYGAYLETKDQKIMHNATDMITEDNLLHGTPKLEYVLGILDNGLVPREISGNASARFKNGFIPETLTPMCSDVWDVHGNMSIKDYFDPKSAHWHHKGENSFLSNRGKDHGAPFMIILDKKSMHPDLLNNSFNVNQSGHSPLINDGAIGGIGDGVHDYPNHRAIPIGAPANAIDRIVVDTRRASSADIQAIRDKIASNGLDIDIYDMNGNLLMAA